MSDIDRKADEKAVIEGVKLYYDAMKHLTTLSTGAIIILVAFLEKIFTDPKWRILVAVAFTNFIISVVAAFTSMINYSNIVSKGGKVNEERIKATRQAFNGSIIAFVLGIICLSVFTLRNLF